MVVLPLVAVGLVALSLWRHVADLGRTVGAATERIDGATARLEAAPPPGTSAVSRPSP